MTIKKLAFLLVAVLFLSCANSAIADDQDAKGSKDHPLITRYPGCVIDQYRTKGFDQFILGLAKPIGGDFTKSMPVEGKITRIGYLCPADRSVIEIFRNYETALKRAGFTTLFTCARGDCGSKKCRHQAAEVIRDQHSDVGAQCEYRRLRNVQNPQQSVNQSEAECQQRVAAAPDEPHHEKLDVVHASDRDAGTSALEARAAPGRQSSRSGGKPRL